jgi:hypothetical protein
MASPEAEAHVEAEARIRDLVSGAVLRLWDSRAGHSDEDVSRFLAGALPLVEAGQRQAVALTDAYVAREMDRQPLGVDPEEAIGPAARNGADPREVYRRPFVTLWWKLKQGVSWEQADSAARARLEKMVRTDVSLAMTHAARAVATADPDVAGIRRVVRGTCELCEDAAGNATPADGLMPLHPGCQCGFEPITKPGMSRTAAPPDRALADRALPGYVGAQQRAATADDWWTDEDLEILSEYLGTTRSYSINQFLRGQDPDLDLDFEGMVADLDAALARSGPVGQPLFAYRGFAGTLKDLGVVDESGRMGSAVGKMFTDRGYSSTTNTVQHAKAFSTAPRGGDTTVFLVQVHRDVRAVWGGNPMEGELMLERGCRYVVRDVRRLSGGRWRVNVDVYPPER